MLEAYFVKRGMPFWEYRLTPKHILDNVLLQIYLDNVREKRAAKKANENPPAKRK